MIETVKAYNRGNFLYSLENKEFKGQIFSNNKFLSLCKELNIDFLSLDEFCNKRKYARFYKAIVVEPLQGGYTYRLWKNRFVTFYDDDVELNEYLLRIYKDKNLLFASPEELWEQRINDLWPYVGYFYLKENPFKLKRIVQSLGQSPVPDLTL